MWVSHAGCALAPRAGKLECKTAGPAPRMLLGHGPRPDATPYFAGEVSPPLPTASNHYSERDTLNMRRCGTLCDPGRQYLYKVQRVGGEGLTEWRREGGGQGSAAPGIATVVGSAVSCFFQPLH